MRLTKIEARDFLSYEALDLDLSDVSQVVVVGQNGHGKSALLDAVLWCLYGEGRGSADQMVRHGALSSWVKTTWEVGAQEVVVTRHRSKETRAGESSLHLEIAGQKVTRHTIAETQEAIEKVVGLPSKTLLAGPFMVQGQSDTLMRARPAERKDLVIRLLDLDRFEQYHEAAKTAHGQVADSVRIYEVRMEDAEEKIGGREGVDAELEEARRAEVDAREAVQIRTEEVASIRDEAVRAAERAKRVEALDADVREANARVDEWTSFLVQADQQLAEQRERAEAEVREPLYESAANLDELIVMARGDLERDEQHVTAAISADQQWRAMNDELERLLRIQRTRDEKGVCATCPFVEEYDAQRASDLLNAVTSMEVPDVEVARSVARATRSNLSEWERDRAEVEHRNELARQSFARLVEFKTLAGELQSQTLARIDQLTSAIDAENDRVTRLTAERLRLGDAGDVAGLTARLQAATAALTSVQEALHSVERLVRAGEIRQAELDTLAKQYAAWEAEVGVLRARERLLALLVKAWHRDGVPTLILENALPAIEVRANELLARMPGDFAVRLVTQRAKKIGGMIETLDVVVETEGQERDYDLLSGGERFRVDLALRVSLAELLTRRSGTKVETLWLDEPLAALDATGRDAVIGSLAAIEDEFGLIVVVSHHDEFNDRFPARIEVTKSDGVSRAEVFA